MDIKNYYSAITDAWKFFKKWAPEMPADDAKWWQIVNEAQQITAAHPEVQDFAARIMVAATKEFEEQDARMRKEKTNDEL